MVLQKKNSLEREFFLFRLFVFRVLFTETAEFTQSQAHFNFAIARGVMCFAFTNCTLKGGEIVLGHSVYSVEPTVGFEPTTCCLQNSCSNQLSYVGLSPYLFLRTLRGYFT